LASGKPEYLPLAKKEAVLVKRDSSEHMSMELARDFNEH
jgi:hypothetical protein